MAYAKYNYISTTTASVRNYLQDVAAILCGETDKTKLLGSFLASRSHFVGTTNGSAVVTWPAANTGVTCAVGQTVVGPGIPDGTTISSITDQTSFTMSANATITNAYAKLMLLGSTTAPFNLIGTDVQTVSSGVSFVTATGVFTSSGSTYTTGFKFKVVITFTGTLSAWTSGNTYYATATGATTFTASATADGAAISGGTGTMSAITLKESNEPVLAMTSGSAVITTTETAGHYKVGQTVTGYGIPASTTISSISAGVSITLSNNCTQSGEAALIIGNGSGVLCDTTNTTISNTYSNAGWTMVDASSRVNGFHIVFRAPYVDDSTQYKYFMLDTNTTDRLAVIGMESWADTTVSYKNPTNSTAIASAAQYLVTTSPTAGTIQIACSARYAAFQTVAIVSSNIVIGAATTNEWVGIFERTRLSPWDTLAAGYPAHVVMGGGAFGSVSTGAFIPRYKNSITGAEVAGSTTCYPVAMGWNGEPATSAIQAGISSVTGASNCGTSGVMKVKIPDGAGGLYTPFNEFRIQKNSTGFQGGSISSVCDVWNTVPYAANLDEITKGSTTYIIWQNNLNSQETAGSVTTGHNSGNTAFPKG